jgi:cysteine-rich repeat protein
VVETGWTCDGVPAECSSLCGNGSLDTGEQCDADQLGGNDCTTIPGEYTGGTLKCSASCLFDTTSCILPSCGDGELNAGEECDDGNTSNEDECLNNCSINTCGDGYLNPAAEACDDGNTSNVDACLTDCTENVCGDGYLDPVSEHCDDGNTSNNDACLTDCTENVCGDGYLDPTSEQCDDGNTSNNDACLVDCTENTCGDGYLDPSSEQCDDGNQAEGDGCTSFCAEELLPVLHSISTIASGWSDSTITYANDPHAPTDPILGAASVTPRNEAYVVTANSFHLLDLSTLSWVEHGSLSSRFAGVSGPNITSAYGGYDTNDPSSSNLFLFEGEWYYLYVVDTATGTVTPDSNNPRQIDWSQMQGPHPDPGQVKSYWATLENDQQWVEMTPEQACGEAGTQTNVYLGALTEGGSLYIYEFEYCFDFIDSMPLSQFPPFSAAGAPLTVEIDATFFSSPTLYVFTQPSP